MAHMNEVMLQVSKMVDFLFKGLITPAERQNLCRDFGPFFLWRGPPAAGSARILHVATLGMVLHCATGMYMLWCLVVCLFFWTS